MVEGAGSIIALCSCVAVTACGRIGFDVTADSGATSPTLLAHTLGAGSGSATVATTPAIDTTGASLLVACISTFDSPTTTTIVFDSYGNTWQMLNPENGNDNNLQLQYVFAPMTGPGHTFGGMGGNGYPAIAVLAFAGTLATSGVAVGQTGDVGTSTTTVAPGSIMANQVDELFVTCTGADSMTNWTDVTVSNQFEITDSQVTGSDPSPEEVVVAYFVTPTLALVGPVWSVLGSNQALNAVMGAFAAP